MTKKIVLASMIFTGLVAFAEQASSVSSQDATGVKIVGGVTDTNAPKPKRKFRVKGNFKGRDPMAAPDGQSQLPPTDGSRPNGQ